MPVDDVMRDPVSGTEESSTEPRLTRRRLLTLGGALVATGILTACMDDDDEDGGSVNDRDGTPTLVGSTWTPDSVIETPQASGTATESGDSSPSTDAGSGSDLERFTALSRALTGFDDLDDSELGQVYLDSVTGNAELSGQLSDLYDKAGLTDGARVVTIEDLESAGAFDDDTRPVADTIATVWYTGRYDAGDDELVVATYINALAWQATGYRATGPSTCSGAIGNWTAAVA